MSEAVTVYDLFVERAARYADKPFIHIPVEAASAYSHQAVEYSYDDARIVVDELVATYRSAGYGPGDRVALMLDNRAESFLHLLAANALGISIVPVGSALLPDEMAYLIRHSDALLLIAAPERSEQANEAVQRAGGSCPVVAQAKPSQLPGAREASPDRESPELGLETEAAMLYTSGTTGKPKGCVLSNDYFLMLGFWYTGLGELCRLEEGAERLITPLPTNHMNALACSFMAMLTSGGCIVQLDRFHPSTWWQSVRDSRATVVHYLGVMPAMLLNRASSESDQFGGQVKFGFGAGVDPRHQETFENRFGFPLIEAWAMTETGSGACIITHREPRHVGTRCIGYAPPELELRLVDEAGDDVPDGEPGELLVRYAGPDIRKGFFTCYYKDAAATEQAWEGGWFHTGDVVLRKEQGSLHFVDRRKNVIRRSGENIAAVEVEGGLFQHSDIANCAVAPVPDELREEEVMALVLLDKGADADQALVEDIMRFCGARMAYYKVPAYFAFVDELPMTASQKVKRGEVKKLCRQLVEEGACFDMRDFKRTRPGQAQ